MIVVELDEQRLPEVRRALQRIQQLRTEQQEEAGETVPEELLEEHDNHKDNEIEEGDKDTEKEGEEDDSEEDESEESGLINDLFPILISRRRAIERVKQIVQGTHLSPGMGVDMNQVEEEEMEFEERREHLLSECPITKDRTQEVISKMRSRLTAPIGYVQYSLKSTLRTGSI